MRNWSLFIAQIPKEMQSYISNGRCKIRKLSMKNRQLERNMNLYDFHSLKNIPICFITAILYFV
jgi:hypothetical protein